MEAAAGRSLKVRRYLKRLGAVERSIEARGGDVADYLARAAALAEREGVSLERNPWGALVLLERLIGEEADR